MMLSSEFPHSKFLLLIDHPQKLQKFHSAKISSYKVQATGSYHVGTVTFQKIYRIASCLLETRLAVITLTHFIVMLITFDCGF